MAESRARGILALELIAAFVAMAVTTPVWGVWVYVLVVPIAVTSALLIGAPALLLAWKKHWTRLYQWIILGGLTGALPFVIVGVVTSLLEHRIDKPASSFYFAYEPLAILSGILTAVAYWLIQVQTTLSRSRAIGLACLAIAGGVVLVDGLILAQGWTPSLQGAHRRAP